MASLASLQVNSISLVSLTHYDEKLENFIEMRTFDKLRSNYFCVSSGIARNCLMEKTVWLVILLTTTVCVIPGLAVSFLRTDLFPTLTDKVE